MKEWQQNNRDKTRAYSKQRGHNKKHKLTKKEWISCKDYFKNKNGEWCCAYCGKTYTQNYEETHKDLHREHVNHQGANDLSNCIPACQICNGSKWIFDMEEWYKQQEFFSEKRLSKIYKWLNEDYKLYIQEKKSKSSYTKKNKE